MCGRFALRAPPAEVIRRFGLDDCADFAPRYNIPPGSDIPVIRISPEDKRVLHLLRWGLVPHWAKDPSMGAKLNNARAETVGEKPAFRTAFRQRRCLIPASGFYEWKTEGRTKQPYYIRLQSAELMALGGLWESWVAPDGSLLRTVCVVTTAANAVMRPIHERMPVIIAPAHYQDWLTAPAEEIGALLAPFPDSALTAWAVSKRVSKVGEDTEDLIAPVEIS